MVEMRERGDSNESDSREERILIDDPNDPNKLNDLIFDILLE